MEAAKNGMRPVFHCSGQFIIAQCAHTLGLIGSHHPHHAAAVAWKRDKHAGTLAGVKLRRNISMWPRMAYVEGQRCLVQFTTPYCDARGFTAQRLPSVGAGYEARRQRFS